MATPTNLSFPTVAYSSIILNWTPGTGSTNTLIVRKQGSIPTSRTDGTTIYEDNGNAFIDTGLTDNTEYCYALYATDGTEYTEPLTECQDTLEVQGLLSRWEFDGSTISDGAAVANDTRDTFNINNGTPLSIAPIVRDGSTCIKGKCLDFINNGSGVAIPNMSTSADIITATAWVNIKGDSISGTYQSILNQSNDSEHRFSFFILNAGKAPGGWIRDSANNSYSFISPVGLALNRWYHIAYVISGNNAKIYIDGNKALDIILAGAIKAGVPLRATIGNFVDRTSYTINGLIDDVRVYDTALSEDEVKSLILIGSDYYTNNGVCGSANGQAFYSAPSTNLCSYGVVSSVSGTGPWTWTCSGATNSVSCFADKGLLSYSRRKPITINSVESLTNHQVKMTIAYDSDMQTDFDDLRFTASDGQTLLNYWIESKTNSSTADVWIKIPSLAIGSNKIYMYYGNPSVSTTSNGDNTFIFFDHFDGSVASTSKWSWAAPVSNSTLSLLGTSSTAWTAIATNNSTFITIGTTVDIRAKAYHYNSTSYGEQIRTNGGSGEQSIGLAYVLSGHQGQYRNTISSASFGAISGYTNQTWAVFSITKLASSALYQCNRANDVIISGNYYSNPQGLFIGTERLNARLDIDWVLIRKYSSTPPTISWGTEQSIN
ncbi:MAG: hypothetical protein BWY21_02058 [Parcubacteria group bacterium ADurb.Bin216]|nr:MAG: hypothetical protein BWY21_02058 [Parcubacteria group bacterium ADurb.Bin216]